MNCTKEGGLPRAFIALNEFDGTVRNTNRVQTAGLFVSFISELGKYYLLSRFDKKEVDSKKYVDYIQSLQEALPHQEQDRSNDSTHGSSGAALQKTPPKRADLEEGKKREDPAESIQEDVPEETLEELLEKLKETGDHEAVETAFSYVIREKDLREYFRSANSLDAMCSLEYDDYMAMLRYLGEKLG